MLGHCFFRLISTFPSVEILFTLLCDQNRIDCKTNAFLFDSFSSIADFTCFAIETHSLPNITFPSEKKTYEKETYENKVELTFRIIFEFKFESKIGTIRNICHLSVRQYDTVTKKRHIQMVEKQTRCQAKSMRTHFNNVCTLLILSLVIAVFHSLFFVMKTRWHFLNHCWLFKQGADESFLQHYFNKNFQRNFNCKTIAVINNRFLDICKKSSSEWFYVLRININVKKQNS